MTEDPRLTPGAYITQARNLYEVIETAGPNVTLENCKTGNRISTYRSSITHHASTYKLVKPAPPLPDTLPADLLTA